MSERLSPPINLRRRRLSPTATSMPASWPDPAPARPPSWSNTSVSSWPPESIPCAFWPSLSPKRPPATCARSSRKPSSSSPKPRQTGARLGLHRARLLRPPAARKRRLRRHRSRVRSADATRILADAAGIHARRHGLALRASTAPPCAADSRPLLLGIRRGRALRLRRHARRRNARRATRRDFPVPAGITVDEIADTLTAAPQSAAHRLELRAEPAPGSRAGGRRAHPQRRKPARSLARHRRLFLQSAASASEATTPTIC